MEWGKQTSYFGVADATPSTPIQGPKYSPFDNEFRAASSRGSPSSSSGVSSGNKATSRHQVAELPASQPYYIKKDKVRTKLHQKHSSKADTSSQYPASNLTTSMKSNKDKEMKKSSNPASRGTADGGSNEASQATNVHKSKQKKVRPYKPQVTGSNASAPSQSKTNPQTSSLFDFTTPAVGGASSNTLTIHRTLSSSSVTSTSSTSKPKLAASDRSNSFNTTPSSRHSGEGHMTSSHSATSHKHKKLASMQPSSGSSSHKVTEEEPRETARVVSIKRTSSLEFIKQPWDKSESSETVPGAVGEMNKDNPVPVQGSGKSTNKKKDKKLRKKLKREKEIDSTQTENMPTSTAAPGTLPTSHTVVSATGHVNATKDHVITKDSTHIKTEVMSKSRPSDLRFTDGLVTLATTAPKPAAAEVAMAGVGVDDVSQDAGDVRSMLQEMMKPLDHSYSLVTPIPTPIKSRPFVFPTEQVSGRHVHMLPALTIVLLLWLVH